MTVMVLTKSEIPECVYVCVCGWLAAGLHTIWAVSLGSVLWFNYSCTEGCKAPGLSTVRGYFYCNARTHTCTCTDSCSSFRPLGVERALLHRWVHGKKRYLRSHENDTDGLSHCTAESRMFESRSSKRFAAHKKLMGRMTEDNQGISWT